ncbi:hypothetical protein B566_EDAN003909 [Ephemera danica]|nr:hypothetical protein B566_EDAN003909 [Ephemera danica]
MTKMEDSKRLIAAIVKFLASEVKANRPTEDLTESIEVAMQCLESAYEINWNDLPNDPPLTVIFKNGISPQPNPFTSQPEASFDAKAEGEKCKNEGNNLVKSMKIAEALEQYTRAIQFDGKNAVFYCNRAAAYNKLSNHHAAVMDCKTAIEIDPTYSKAYGRLGVAYACMKMHQEAVDSYKKALELEPDNQTYLSNCRLSESVLEREVQPAVAPTPLQEALGTGGMQFNTLLNNPALVNMATEVLSDPNMHSLMNNLLSGSGIDALMQAGQTLAQQMQASNPELIENLRRQVSGAANPNAEQQPPPNPPSE